MSIFIQFMILKLYDNAPERQSVGLLEKSQKAGEVGLSRGVGGRGRNINSKFFQKDANKSRGSENLTPG